VGTETCLIRKKQEAVFRGADLLLMKLFSFVSITEILNIYQTQVVNEMGSCIHLDFCKHQYIQLFICLSLPPSSFFISSVIYVCKS